MTNDLPPARVYLAGPNQHSLCSWLEGHHVLESFANNLGGEDWNKTPEDYVAEERKGDNGNLARYRYTFASVCLDSGVYSNMTAERRGEGPVVTIGPYIEFAVRHGAFYDFCASFDDITGGPEANRRNWIRCRDAGIPRLMPVFHQGEPLSLLAEYCAASHYVGLGFQRPIRDEARWLDSCFAVIPEGRWVHGFAMTNYLRWPFRSADSTTWLNEMLAMEKASGQGRSALAYLTKRELTELVVKKYQRQWRQDLWRGTIGSAAGRGEQMDLEQVISELKRMEEGQ
jgi:hypothetical protein